jgi:NitT/TauT family transport system substrate-binding protein
MQSSRWYRSAATALLLSAAVMAAGCGGGDDESSSASSGDTATAEKKELRKIKMRFNFAPDGGQAGYFLAKEKGYFEEEGLDVELLDGKASTLTGQEIAAGNVEFGTVGTVALFQLIAQGSDLVSVAAPVGKNVYGIFFDEKADIHTLKDLEGKSMITSPGSPETIFLPVAYALGGVDGDKIENISVNSSAKFGVYAQGKGDSLGFALPSKGGIHGARPSRSIAFQDIGVPFPGYSIVTRPEVVRDEPELVAAFLRAAFRGLVEADEDPGAAVAIQHEMRPETDIGALTGQYKNEIEFLCHDASGQPYGFQPPEEWAAATELFNKYGGIDTKLVAEDLYTNEFFEPEHKIETTKCA